VDYFPVFMDLRSRRCLVVGGGDVAVRKARLLLRAGGHVLVVAPALNAEAQRLVGPQFCHVAREYRALDLDGVVLAIAATDDRAVNSAVARDAMARQLPVNVVDAPELCSVIVPALVDRSPLLFAVGSGGGAPVLARSWRARIEAEAPARLGELAEFSAAARVQVHASLPDEDLRRRFWEAVFEGEVAELVLHGERAAAERALAELLTAYSEGSVVRRGVVSLIGAGPNDPDLVSLRALRELQRAAIVVYAPSVSGAIVDLSRRDAIRHGLRAWPVADLTQVLQPLSARVNRGQAACLLGPGDAFREPAGRALERWLVSKGLTCSVVPGITSEI